MTLKEFVKNKQWRKWQKNQWLLIFLAGVLVLVIAMPVGSKKEGTEEPVAYEATDAAGAEYSYEEQLEHRVESILQTIEGVGAVKVMITLKNKGEAVVEKDVESSYSTSGDPESEEKEYIIQRETTETTIYESQTQEAGPFISKENVPEVEGVLVVAQGGSNPVTVQHISEAIQALFDIEIHKIKIVKMNAQEGTH